MREMTTLERAITLEREYALSPPAHVIAAAPARADARSEMMAERASLRAEMGDALLATPASLTHEEQQRMQTPNEPEVETEVEETTEEETTEEETTEETTE